MSEEISLSVEESNALRLRLGLSALREDDDTSTAAPGKSSLENDVLLAPVVPGEKDRENEMRDKLSIRKEKREIETKLKQVKTLGEASDDEEDSAAAWVKRSRDLTKLKEEAQKKAQMLADMDREFEEAAIPEAKPRSAAYTAKHLKGMTVKHDVEHFQEGQETILTLEDRGVLDDDEEDVLVNVNIAEDERTRRKVEEARQPSGYDPKRGLNADDEEAMLGLNRKSVLDKYDDVDVLTGEKKLKETKSFRIGHEDLVSAEEQRKEEIRRRLLEDSESLAYNSKSVSDFYSAEEAASFKKKKRKVRKKTRRVRADDLLALEPEEEENQATSLPSGETRGSQTTAMDTEDDVAHAVRDEEDILDQAQDEELAAAERELEAELHASLTRARRARQNNRKKTDVTDLLNATVKKAEEAKETMPETVVFSAMTEFVRGIGTQSKDDDQPTKRRKSQQEQVPQQQQPQVEGFASVVGEEASSGFRDVEQGSFRGSFSTAAVTTNEEHARRREEAEEDVDDTPILGDEGNVGSSVAAALQLAKRKGYLEQKKAAMQVQTTKKLADLTSKHSEREDQHNDDRGSIPRRDSMRGRNDPFSIPGYAPSFRLEYTDDRGREVSAKEAFTLMSHKFHGKASGRAKTEKKLRKQQQEESMRQLSSNDTLLGSVAGLRQHQERTGQAHIVLSGSQK
eukprot:m.22889 g.22889  ORF g.22889 m.22889 type:complete len:683 (+) comp9392_c0_seq1:49-2097(+)